MYEFEKDRGWRKLFGFMVVLSVIQISEEDVVSREPNWVGGVTVSVIWFLA